MSQVVLCLLLLFGAGLFVRSLRALDAQDGRFDRDAVLIMRVEPRGSDQRGVPGASERLDRTYRDLLQRVAAVPGVRAASLAHFSPTTRVGYFGPGLARRRHTAARSTDDGLPELFCNDGPPVRCRTRLRGT